MTDDLTPDTDEALRFLEWLRPGGPWLLSAKRPDGPFETRSVADVATAREWIHARNGRSNLYVMINPAREGLNKKATKEDVSELAFLAVDLDVKQGSLEDGLERIEIALVDFDPAPSGVIFSGGGYWAFWRLREPVHLGGGLAQIAAAEAYNRGLEVALGGDHCHNVDRVCRLPGTINIPDKAKRDRGRTRSLASIVDLTDAIYGLEDFTPAADAPPSRSSGSGAPTRVHIGDDLPRLKSLDELPEAVTQRTRMLIVHGDDPDDPTRYGSKSEVMWAVTCELVRAGCDDHTIAAVLLDPDFGVSDHPLRQKGSVTYVERQVGRARQFAHEVDPRGRRVLSFASPYRTALRLHTEAFPNTIHVNGDWLDYQGGAYGLVENLTMTSRLYRLLSDAVVAVTKEGQTVYQPFNPDPGKVDKVEKALKAVVHEEAGTKAPPAWLSGEGPPPLEVISCRNGLLHLPSGELLLPTPDFFTRNALDIAYDPGASEPGAWLAFLRELWPEGAEVDVLQEMFGCLLLPDTSFQKIFLLVGPPRSGKGTILKVLVDLIGKANTCAPSASELGKDFGLEPLIGKQLAAVTDMRLGKRADLGEIASNLLRISGEDDVSANRKGKSYWTGRLAVRFLILANSLPKFNEDSPALSRRFVPLILSESFLGREDRGLADRLRGELPGILNWAIAGWRRLQERGTFVLPPRSEDAICAIQEQSSAIVAFLSECCDEGGDHRVGKDELYAAWSRWCAVSGETPGTKGNLTQLLSTARTGKIRAIKTGTESRIPSYSGLRLKALPDARSSGDDGRPAFWD